MSPADAGRAGRPLDGIPRAGRTSSIVKEVKALVRSAADRRRRRVIVVEGPALAAEILSGPHEVQRALVSPRLARERSGARVIESLRALGDRARSVEDGVLASLADVEAARGILLVVERPRWDLAAILALSPSPLVLVAHGIQDPGNLGALARVAEAAWGTALVCLGGADPWSPRSVRAAAGSIPRLPVIEASRAAPVIDALRGAGLRLAGAAAHDAPSYIDADLGGPMALFVGSEGTGLPPDVSEALDLLVTIPVREGVESLNVAAAAAVLLFHRAQTLR